MLKQLSLAGAILIALAAPAFAQQYTDTNGTNIPPVMSLPYPYVPLPPGQHNLAPTSATKLTVPSTARVANVCASTAVVRYTTDGATAPTSTIGQPLAAGACTQLSGPLMIGNFNAFSSTGTLDVEYFR